MQRNSPYVPERDLLELAHPRAYGIFQEDSDSFCSEAEEDVPQSRVSLHNYQREST